MLGLGSKVRVKLGSGQWYTGQIKRTVKDFDGKVKYEVQGEDPKPFVTIAKAKSLVELP